MNVKSGHGDIIAANVSKLTTFDENIFSMIFGVGTDICECVRMQSALTRTESLKNKLFTAAEQQYCEGNAICFQHYAARFAAKEAFFKALGTGYRYGLEFHEMEVANDELGKPYFIISGKVAEYCEQHHITKIHLSMSHVKEMASAFVVIENE